jgi:hypothetical protein
MKPLALLRSFGFMLLVLAANTSGAAAQSQPPALPAPLNLDIVGIKLGMPIKDALAAVKADNPGLSLTPQTLQLEGFAQPFVTTVMAQQAGVAGKDTEGLELQFTMPPARQVLWGVRRTYSYTKENMPSLENTLAALRKKYGPENIPADTDLRNLTKNITWIFDAQGRPVPSGEAKSLNMTCTNYLGTPFGGGAGIRNDLAGANPPPAQCIPLSMVTASVQASSGVIPGSIVVYNLILQLADGPIYRTSLEATRAIAIAAANNREHRQKQEVDKRGAPKI